MVVCVKNYLHLLSLQYNAHIKAIPYLISSLAVLCWQLAHCRWIGKIVVAKTQILDF